MLTWIVKKILRPQWVSFNCGHDWELGVKIWGVTFALYKSEVYYPENIKQSRKPEKREYGESVHPQEIVFVGFTERE